MIATYQGSGSELACSAEIIFEQPSVVAAPAVGSAQHSGVEALVTPPKTAFEDDVEG